MPDILLSRDVNLLQLFQQSYAGWTQARPYTLPSERRDSDPMLVTTGRLPATRTTTCPGPVATPYVANPPVTAAG